MKTTKTNTSKKTSKKTTKPAFIVDMTDCETVNDLKIKFIEAKVNNNLPITKEDLKYYAAVSVEATLNLATALCCLVGNTMCHIIAKKKQPWYKKLWNKITGK